MSFSTLGFLLGLLPLFVLTAFLLGDRYPGEQTIARLRHSIRDLAARTGGQSCFAVPALRSRTVRGGRLIACSLAGRSPPVEG